MKLKIRALQNKIGLKPPTPKKTDKMVVYVTNAITNIQKRSHYYIYERGLSVVG